MKNLTNETAAQAVYDAAILHFTQSHNIWAGDVRMMKTMTANYLDFIKIANLIQNDQTIKAHAKMCRLDPELRNDIPESVWEHCDKI